MQLEDSVLVWEERYFRKGEDGREWVWYEGEGWRVKGKKYCLEEEGEGWQKLCMKKETIKIKRHISI